KFLMRRFSKTGLSGISTVKRPSLSIKVYASVALIISAVIKAEASRQLTFLNQKTPLEADIATPSPEIMASRDRAVNGKGLARAARLPKFGRQKYLGGRRGIYHFHD